MNATEQELELAKVLYRALRSDQSWEIRADKTHWCEQARLLLKAGLCLKPAPVAVLTDAQVEAAAKAMFKAWAKRVAWHQISEDDREEWRKGIWAAIPELGLLPPAPVETPGARFADSYADYLNRVCSVSLAPECRAYLTGVYDETIAKAREVLNMAKVPERDSYDQYESWFRKLKAAADAALADLELREKGGAKV